MHGETVNFSQENIYGNFYFLNTRCVSQVYFINWKKRNVEYLFSFAEFFILVLNYEKDTFRLKIIWPSSGRSHTLPPSLPLILPPQQTVLRKEKLHLLSNLSLTVMPLMQVINKITPPCNKNLRI